MKAAREQVVAVDGHQIKLSNLDKVLYPRTQTTKADVLAYYAQVGPMMVPHLIDRPATRKRWPDGVGAEEGAGGRRPTVFFNKDLGAGAPDWVVRYKIAHADHDNYYPVINDLATLTWLAQLAALEIHVPQWRFGPGGEPRNPDRLVLDLDPGEGVTLADCAEIAGLARGIVRDLFDAVDLQVDRRDPVPVTSGSKGLHLYAPLDGSLTPAQVTDLARELALGLEADHPDRVISQMKRSERGGKVFVDWSQNNGAKTTVSPYSLRGRDLPTVAAPRTWEELRSVDLRHLTYEEMLARSPEVGDLLQGMAPAPGASADRLATYRSMRDSSRTPEPVPQQPPAERDGHSFVIQEHHARRLHYDVRLERNGVLVSWAVPKAPPTDKRRNHLAVQTEDHPLEYGSFEGDIPRGEYGGGAVKIWDTGHYRLHKWRDGKEVIVTLFGRPDGGLGGVRKYALIHTGGGGSQPEKNWLMHLMDTDPEDLHPQPVAEPTDSGRVGEPVRPRPLEGPAHLEPMLATLVAADDVRDEDDWAFEMKWDGVRLLAHVAGDQVELRSRKGRDETAAYPEIVEALADVVRVQSAVLDGEVVVLDPSGRPSFGLLQNRINLTKPGDIERAAKVYPAQLMVFDLLELDAQSLLAEPYEERRRVLEALVPATPGSRVQVPPIFDGDLAAALETAAALRLEGVVAKRRGSPYQAGRRGRSWLKIKLHRTQEVVVGGWRPGQGRRDGGVGSLLVGVPDDGGLRYVGRVGSGLNDAQLADLQIRLAALARPTSPLVGIPREDARDAHWVEPSLVGEVTYGELTGPGRLRHPVWRGLRHDKDPQDVTWESPNP